MTGRRTARTTRERTTPEDATASHPLDPTLTARLLRRRAGEPGFGDQPAVADLAAAATYDELLRAADRIALALEPSVGAGEARTTAPPAVAILVEPSVAWVAAAFGAWRARAMAVPLALAHPEPELEHVLRDSGARTVLASRTLSDRLGELTPRLGLRILAVEEILGAASDGSAPQASALGLPDPDQPALLLYTSGTTGRPKGVPLRHRHLRSQVETLAAAWSWSADDHILGVLPLHHVHGIVNVLLCALWSGARVTLLPAFAADRVWGSFAGDDPPTLFMAVPTIYRRLIESWERADAVEQTRLSAGARRLRLMVSGSAALPAATLEHWRALTGHTLLERYGMTEIGMALSHDLAETRAGTSVPGTVGGPLPGVEIRIVDEDGNAAPDGVQGELEVRGPGVFDGYWRRAEATRNAFRDDGFFRTGDIAVREDGRVRLLGRASVDLLKSGGEKISALEVEDVLRRHSAIADVAVVGLPDPDWGDLVTAVVERADPAEPLDPDALRAWAKECLAAYKVPRRVEVIDALPRNALGKVQKPRVVEWLRTRPSEG